MANQGALAQLHKHLHHHEQIVTAIRTTLALPDDHASTKTAKRAPDVLAQALALDRQRKASSNGSGPRIGRPPKNKQPSYWNHETVKERRKRTAAFLELFNATTPTPAPSKKGKGGALGIMIQHGFLKKKGDGYIRTGKVFTP